ncbi:hypothetical protein [Caproiciproducens faecalis]|uniref:DUF3953 domain-containing protein n=1 Tax=Caproiciproducens faecalis TaxID=2820301 RepID=A0ABS7DNP6_9FIRM|nr:hypothetical protein [Caproiciproducens faecalis]MBW7572828.1 hypothetical protein [Caproiciproducens faecalis]
MLRLGILFLGFILYVYNQTFLSPQSIASKITAASSLILIVGASLLHFPSEKQENNSRLHVGLALICFGLLVLVVSLLQMNI